MFCQVVRALLAFVLTDLNAGTYNSLSGLPLVPLANGEVRFSLVAARFSISDSLLQGWCLGQDALRTGG